MSNISPFPNLTLDAGKAYGLDYLRNFGSSFAGGWQSDPNEILGYSISGNTVNNGQIIKVIPTYQSRWKNGMTFWARMKSTSGAAILPEIRLRSTAGGNLLINTPALATGYAWYPTSFRPDQLGQTGGQFIQINNSPNQLGANFSISEFYLEEAFYNSTAPTVGTWETGAYVKNINFSGSPANLGWWCTSGGSPGLWSVENIDEFYSSFRVNDAFNLSVGPYRHIWSGASNTGILPAPSLFSGKELVIKNVSPTGTLTLSGIVDYGQNLTLTPYQFAILWSDSNSWLII